MSERVLSTISYEQVSEELRRKYPIHSVWDDVTCKLIGKPFRFIRVKEHMYAVYKHNEETLRVPVIDARCACLLYMILKNTHAMSDPLVAKILAQRTISNHAHISGVEEPEYTTRLRVASSNFTRQVSNLASRVSAKEAMEDDGAGWKYTFKYMDASSSLTNPPVALLNKRVSSLG